mgnify:FL=1
MGQLRGLCVVGLAWHDLIDDVMHPETVECHSLSAKQAVQRTLDLKECKRSSSIVAVWLTLATGEHRGRRWG